MTYLHNRFQLNIEGIKLVIKWYGETLKTSSYMKEIIHKKIDYVWLCFSVHEILEKKII